MGEDRAEEFGELVVRINPTKLTALADVSGQPVWMSCRRPGKVASR
jgi:hypothetical protein